MPPTILHSAGPACGCRTRSIPCNARPTGCSAGQHNDLEPALAGATPYLRLFALAAGGALLAQEALAAKRIAENGADAAARIAIARFFAENLAVQAGGLERTVVEGADSVNRADAALA